VKIGAIILAAGASTRLGSPKQLLSYGGNALLRRAAQAALSASCRPVVVVLGSGAGQVRAALAELDVEIVVNASWQQGMGTSIRLGISQLEGSALTPEAALLMVCDQPFVDDVELARLIHAFERASTETALAAAHYNATAGVPAIFGRAHFGALRALPDDAGAKRVLLAHGEAVIAVEMPCAAVDIDTWEQYERLAQHLERSQKS
jgi:molybdenum cofactor cytidylyltransferase